MNTPLEAFGACGLVTLCLRRSLLKPDACRRSLQIVGLGWPGGVFRWFSRVEPTSPACATCCYMVFCYIRARLLNWSAQEHLNMHMYVHRNTSSHILFTKEACVWPGVTKVGPEVHLSKCVIHDIKGLFKCLTLLHFFPPLVLFSRGIQNKYAFCTICNTLSSHSPPRYAIQVKNHRHFFRRCQNINATLQVME